MPRKDLPPVYNMDPLLVSTSRVASQAMREELEEVLVAAASNAQPDDHNGIMSVGAECLAAQLNLLADKLLERRKVTTPDWAAEAGHSDCLRLILDDVKTRAQLRRLRRDDA